MKNLRSLWILKVFVDIDADIRLARLIKRAQKERRLYLDSIISKYKNTLKPMHEKYIEPSKEKADNIIFVNRDYNETGFSIKIEI